MFDFQKRKRQLDVHAFVRRVIDVSSPNVPPCEGESRWENRSNRTIPVLIAPFDEDEPLIGEAVFALTKNIAGSGAALVLQQPFRATDVVVAFRLESQRRFVRGRVRQTVALGGGYWQLGVSLTELLDEHEHPALGTLSALVDCLEPRRPTRQELIAHASR